MGGVQSAAYARSLPFSNRPYDAGPLTIDGYGPALVREVHGLDPNLSPSEVLTMGEQVDRSTGPQRTAVAMLGDLLYKVSPRDPVAFAAAIAVMAVSSAVACLLPAWRAARTDPVRAMRG